MKPYILKAQFVFVTLLVSICFMACNKSEDCAYDTPCIDDCIAFEDFKDSTIGNSGNWMGIGTAGVTFQSRGGSTVLEALDAGGASNAYNSVDFPKNLLAAGCEFVYDVEYFAGTINSVLSDNSLRIYRGPNSISSTFLAYFELNASNMIVSGSPPVTIHVPLELATGTTLPSNSFGRWVIGGISTPTAADIANFNTLIQNASGIGFNLDETGDNPSEQWWYDNFCFRQCCPQQNNL